VLVAGERCPVGGAQPLPDGGAVAERGRRRRRGIAQPVEQVEEHVAGLMQEGRRVGGRAERDPGHAVRELDRAARRAGADERPLREHLAIVPLDPAQQVPQDDGVSETAWLGTCQGRA
jgi:hypothetical protein